MATYQKILVPLDGSKQSECILDHVRIIAKALGTPKVVLLKVVEPFSSGAIAVIGDTQAKKVLAETKRAAEEYLSYAAGTLRTHCAGVEQIVIEGNADHSCGEIKSCSVLNKVIEIIVGRPYRPDNRCIQYRQSAYSSSDPFCGCR